MIAQARIDKLSKLPAGPLGERVLAELRYANEISLIDNGQWDTLMGRALQILEAGIRTDGAITGAAALEAERTLLPMSPAAKRYTLLCAGHAHIDMNWMWRYDETVSITLDTFRTVLNLMEEYPEFRFSQSQAYVYEIVERYDPEMLEEIKLRVAEGRWEVTAVTWVEADRNMPSGESIARHLLYSRKYLTKLLGIPAEELTIDYEPDTFGHGALTPEMLIQGGAKYYYHCRGDEGGLLYRWRGLSGAEVLSYRDLYWYCGPIDFDLVLSTPSFCEKYGMDTHIRVYGVGDHGGGPTRRDIERVLDMASWPVFPKIRFGTYKEFFSAAEKAKYLPVKEGEMNPVHTGCYTSQARITQGNRFGEAKLDEAERFSAQAMLRAKMPYRSEIFETAWRDVLFNQFHDILPGSGIVDTREYAMGLYAKAYAAADTQKSKALRALGALADTSAWATDEGMNGTTSEGGGVGFGIGFGMTGLSPTSGPGGGLPFRIAQTERGRGINRVFHVFNPSAVPRTEIAELIMFDWPGDYRRLRVLNADGTPVPHQLVDDESHEYCHHYFRRVLAKVELPAGGRTVCICTQDDDLELPPVIYPTDSRTEPTYQYKLENELLLAEFCPETGALLSLFDKENGIELLRGPSAFFRIIDEEPRKSLPGTSWVVGRYRSVSPLLCDTMSQSLAGPLKNTVTIMLRIRSSTVTYTVSLAAGTKWLDIDCDADWREVGIPLECTPQLNFTLPIAACEGDFIHDIPGGLLERSGAAQDMPCQSFAAARYAPGQVLMLMSDSKYGFRCENGSHGASMSLTCIRSSSDPDPIPDYGRHRFRIGVGISSGCGVALLNTSYAFCHPASAVSDLPHHGTQPPSAAGVAVSGAFLQAIKRAEDSEDLIFRLVNPEKTACEAVVALWADVSSAAVTDTHEQLMSDVPALRVEGPMVYCPISAHGVVSIRIKL